MKQIKLAIIILCTLISTQQCLSETTDLNTLWQQAEQLYTEQRYDEAAESYRRLLSYGSSAALYYNYANALFKAGELGPAILNYERALRLDPSNENIQFNLKYANDAKTDKIEPIQPFFAKQWIDALESTLTSNQWAYTSIIAFIVTLTLILLYLFGKLTWLRKTAFFTAIASLIITIISLTYSFTSKTHALQRNDAIVMTGSVSVKSSPDDSGTEVFVIHEGTKVEIRSSVGDWYEIKIADGNIGWLTSSAVEKI